MRKKCNGKQDVFECFSLLPECFNPFLSALPKNRAQSRLLYLLLSYQRIRQIPLALLFLNETNFDFRRKQNGSQQFFTLIKHANISQSESFLKGSSGIESVEGYRICQNCQTMKLHKLSNFTNHQSSQYADSSQT